MNDEILIKDIYWDRIYLNIELTGKNLDNKMFMIATKKDAFSYPLTFHPEKNMIVINITNINNREMLDNRTWYIKYKNDNYANELIIYEKEYEEYLQEKNSNHIQDMDIKAPLKPLEWIPIPISIDLGYKLAHLDKVYRYAGTTYAYVISFSANKFREKLICTLTTTFMVKNNNPHKRYFNIETKKWKKRIKKRIIYYAELFNNFIYQILSRLFPKKGDKILLMSETRAPISGNLKVLNEYLIEHQLDKKFKISYYFTKTLEKRRSRIFFIWLKLAFLTAKQDFIFVDDYSPFFKYITLHPKTKLIQVWHAGVGFKSVGYARFGEKGSPYPFDTPHRKYSYTIVGGQALQEVYAEAFGIDEKDCLPYGVMRIDGYMDKQKISDFKKTFYQEYPQFQNKKIILFAPTFRGTGQRSAHYPYKNLDFKQIYDMCADEYIFLIKMHPFITKLPDIPVEFQDKIIDFSSFPDINQLFYVTDILITDYSSNIYEFSLQKKPIIFYAFDKDEYELLRSVHRRLDDDAPGKVCQTFEEVIDTIHKKDFQLEKLELFVKKNFDDSHLSSCEQVVNNILNAK